VITVVLNRSTEIRQTVESVLGQAYPNLEYVVIDGGSSDGTLGVLREYGSRLGMLVSEPDRGIYDAMNKGVRLASGDYLAFMNAGDWFVEPRTLEALVRLGNGADVIYGDAVLCDPSGVPIRRLFVRRFSLLNLAQGFWTQHQSAIFARWLFEDTPFRHEEYGTAADFAWFVEVCVAKHPRVRRVRVPVAYVRQGGVSESTVGPAQAACRRVILQRLGPWGARAYDLRRRYAVALEKLAPLRQSRAWQRWRDLRDGLKTALDDH
jgi:glycosyltransferase involved in cell wall biosynthesis